MSEQPERINPATNVGARNGAPQLAFDNKAPVVNMTGGEHTKAHDEVRIVIGPVPARAGLEHEWRALELHGNASYFVSWAWIGNWLASLPPDLSPQLLRATTNGETVGLGIVVQRRLYRNGFVVSHGVFLHATGDPVLDEITVEYNGFLHDRHMPDAASAMARFLADNCGRWDEIYFNGLINPADYEPQPGRKIVLRQRLRSFYFVDLDELRRSGAEYLGLIGQNTRHNIRRSRKEYEKLGDIRIDAATDVGQALGFLNELKRLHQIYWIGKGQAGSFASACFSEFHRRLVSDRFDAGEIQLLRVRAGERLIGYLYNFVHGGRVYNYQSGFDYEVCERFNRPGLVSHHMAIEYNLRLGHHVYDLMAGDSQYKQSMSTHSGEMAWLVWQRPRWRFRIEYVLRRLKRWLTGRVAATQASRDAPVRGMPSSSAGKEPLKQDASSVAGNPSSATNEKNNPGPVERPLRIVMVVDGYYPGMGGSEAQVKLLSRALMERGHAVSIMAPRLEPDAPLHELIDGVPVERMSYPRIRVAGAIILMFRFGWWLLRRRRDYDVMHIHMVKNLATVAGFLCPLLNFTVIIKISGAWEFDGGVLDPSKRRGLITRVRNACIRSVDYVQCISLYTRERLREAGYPEHKLCMIPNAVQMDRFATNREPFGHGIPTVVFVGRIQPVKGLNILLAAWKQVMAKMPAKLIVGGDGPILPELRRIALDTGIADSVTFPGLVDDVPALLARGDVYVQPSFQEGLPNSVLEAMAAGLPVVATRISGNEDVVTDGVNGRLVPAGDVDSLAQALISLLADPVRAGEFGRNSRRIVDEQFRTAAVIDRLTQIYRRE